MIDAVSGPFLLTDLVFAAIVGAGLLAERLLGRPTDGGESWVPREMSELHSLRRQERAAMMAIVTRTVRVPPR